MAKRRTPQSNIRHRDDDDAGASHTAISSDDSEEEEEEDPDEDDDTDDDDDSEEEEEDRGDEVGNRRDDDDDDDSDEDEDDDTDEDDESEEEEDDTDDLDEETLRDIGGTGTVPLARLNEVLEQNRQLTERLIAVTGGGKPTGAPAAEDPPAFDLKAKIKERNAKLLEGDEDAAATLDEEIIQYHQKQGAAAGAQAARELIEQDRTNAAVAEVMRDYPQLNDAKKKTFDADALQEVITLRNGYIQNGMSVAEALRKAANRLLGKAAREDDDGEDDEDRARGKRKVAKDPNQRSVKQLRNQMRRAQRTPPSLRNAGSGGKPAGGEMTAEQLARMPESKFKRLDPKAKSEARGDFVDTGEGRGRRRRDDE